jgi:DNA-binding CsgD family transcriptional regulator
VTNVRVSEHVDLVGRAVELAAAERFLAASPLPGVGPRALVFSGTTGIGKTIVWETALATAAARSTAVMRAAPAAAECDLPYAGLTDLLHGVPRGVLDALPEPQRRALLVATLNEPSGGFALDRRTVAAGLLGVLRRQAEQRPLIVAIDDVQWLDAASSGALEFAVRRLEDDDVRLLLAIRGEGDDSPPLGLERALPPDRLDRVALGPLSVAALFQLLRARLGHAFARPTLLRVAEWSAGNPLFALEIGRAILASGGAPEAGAPPPVPRQLAEAVARRMRSLSVDERRTLLVVACAAHPSRAMVAEACRRLRWRVRWPDDPTLIAVSASTLRPGHPLVGAQVIAIAPDEERRSAHRALAELADGSEERARHLALAATGPDELVAAALEGAASQAAARGAPEMAIELADLAARLTPPDEAELLLRRRRALGELLLRAGETRRARDVLDAAVEVGPPGLERALTRMALAELVTQDEGPAAAAEQCRVALDEVGADPIARARIELAWSRVSPDARDGLGHARSAVELLPDDQVGLRAQALAAVVSGISTLGEPVPADLLEEAVRLEVAAPPARLLDGAAAKSAWLRLMDDDLDRAHREYDALRERADQLGDESSLARILVELAQIDLRAGRWDEVEEHALEGARVADRAGREHDRMMAHIQLGAIAAARGVRPDAERYLGEAGRYADRAGDAFIGAIVAGNLGALALAEADPAAAERAFAAAEERFAEAGLADTALGRFQADRLEALVELGEVARAAALAAELETRARRNGRRRPLAFVARGRGFVAAANGDLDVALDAFSESVEGLQALGMRFEVARSLLARGIAHRRRREKRLGHDDLARALETFEALGATAWAERTRRELARIGLRPSAPAELTETERTVAALAAEGRTNREIAALAFMSPRTVEGVLARVYPKLGIGSRAELGRALVSVPPPRDVAPGD